MIIIYICVHQNKTQNTLQANKQTINNNKKDTFVFDKAKQNKHKIPYKQTNNK